MRTGGRHGSAGAGPSRRRVLGVAGAGGVAGLAGLTGLGVGVAVARAEDPADPTYPFHGEHQAGIVTPAQDRLAFAAFDVAATSRGELEALLRRWSAAAEQLTCGEPVDEGGSGRTNAPPGDTGEALGLSAARLTLTFGVGPSLFVDAQGRDRFGLAARRPAALARLPHFPGDRLDPRRSDGDLCVQACADDPQVAVHAIRNLARLAFGTASLRWSQLGFGRTSSTARSQQTPRNLFGFKDGTANLTAEDTTLLDTHVWVGPDDDRGAAWLGGGSYLVARRISMSIETWDRTSIGEQEALVGRDRPHGAPLSGGQEHTEPDFDAVRDGAPAMPLDSHVRLAHPSRNAGVRMLRRGYNFADGSDGLGRLDAGLFFLAYVRDPLTHYVPMQSRLATRDGLREYLTHTGSALFAVPPGARPGGFVGETLLA